MYIHFTATRYFTQYSSLLESGKSFQQKNFLFLRVCVNKSKEVLPYFISFNFVEISLFILNGLMTHHMIYIIISLYSHTRIYDCRNLHSSGLCCFQTCLLFYLPLITCSLKQQEVYSSKKFFISKFIIFIIPVLCFQT